MSLAGGGSARVTTRAKTSAPGGLPSGQTCGAESGALSADNRSHFERDLRARSVGVHHHAALATCHLAPGDTERHSSRTVVLLVAAGRKEEACWTVQRRARTVTNDGGHGPPSASTRHQMTPSRGSNNRGSPSAAPSHSTLLRNFELSVPAAGSGHLKASKFTHTREMTAAAEGQRSLWDLLHNGRTVTQFWSEWRSTTNS